MIIDKSDFSVPITFFNSHELEAYTFQEHMKDFEKVNLIDEENLAAYEMPKYFKAVYIQHDKFMLIGGVERMDPNSSSSRSFLINE